MRWLARLRRTTVEDDLGSIPILNRAPSTQSLIGLAPSRSKFTRAIPARSYCLLPRTTEEDALTVAGKRSIHADAGRTGKAVEHLIAALCVLGSDGELNAWTSLVDDEGVDLVLQRRNRPETLSLQVKSRLTTAKGIAERKRFQSQVRAATLRPRSDLYMLFVVANPATLDLGPIWLVPSRSFVKKAPAGSSGKHRFVASAKPGTRDRWAAYLVTKVDLRSRLLAALPN